MIAGLAASAPLAARAKYVPQKTTLAILASDGVTHRMDIRDVEGYRIFRAVPNGGADRAIYLLDGNGAFDALTQDLLNLVPDVAILAIGYPTDLRFDADRRSLDYTPPLGDMPVPDPQRNGRMSGGANLFLPLLRAGLRDAAEQGLAIRYRTLWGHSFGGLFTLYTLFTAPSSFDHYAAISPSLWWGNEALAKVDRVPIVKPTRLLIAYGDSEARRGDLDEETFRRKQAEGAIARNEFVDGLRTTPHLGVDEQVFRDLGHGETLAASLPFAFALAR